MTGDNTMLEAAMGIEPFDQTSEQENVWDPSTQHLRQGRKPDTTDNERLPHTWNW